MSICLHDFHSECADLLNHCRHVAVADERDFTDSFQSQLLNVFIIHLCSFKKTIHDERSLIIDLEVLSGHRHSPCQSLNGNERQLLITLIDVEQSGVQDLLNLPVAQSLVIHLDELHSLAECLHSCESVGGVLVRRVFSHRLQELVPLANRQLNSSDNGQANASILHLFRGIVGQLD
jgi:hypothetical protein